MKKNRTQLSAVLGLVFLALAHPRPGTLLLGLLFIIPGESLRIWSSGYIRKNEMLSTTGPYSLSRNPLYVGSFIMGVGFIISMGVVWMAFLFFVFFTGVYWFTIRWEEDKLERRFSEDWERYRNTTPRLVPLLRIPEYHGGDFAWQQVHKNREFYNAGVVLLVYALLWGKAALYGA